MTTTDQITVAETGWKRLNGAIMRWVGEPLPNKGCHALQLEGRTNGLSITTAYLDEDVDLDDAEEVAEELERGWPSVIPLPAMYVLRFVIDQAIAGMEAHQAATGAEVDPEDCQPAGQKVADWQ